MIGILGFVIALIAFALSLYSLLASRKSENTNRPRKSLYPAEQFGKDFNVPHS